MRVSICIALLAVSCTSLSPGGPVDEPRLAPSAQADVPVHLAPAVEQIEAMEIGFVDPVTLEHYRATGPYRVVSWGNDGMKLVGRDADRLGAAHLNVRTRADSTWLIARIRDREFLLRMN